ncbi:restriction system protein [Rhizomicrobium palustre]|uniref:Restriction system protein n=1 Tax=Rhizomicrobium palustre TaxID=189966 RepID=A0A846N1C3_9PROT|nr:restriction endonuclease [Rhizomicrobium palustre]NIK89265.1 restriction system protein [Rhizomicrobium palustre]
MPIPDYQTLMLPILRLSSEAEKSVSDVESEIADQFRLSEDDRNELLPSGKQRVFHNRLHWAKFYLSKAGLMSIPRRGRFIATEAGKELLRRGIDKIDLRLLLEIPSFKEFYRPDTATAAEPSSNAQEITSNTDSAQTPEEEIDTAHKKLTLALRAELLDRISRNSPAFFEQTIVDLLVAMGYGGSHKDAAQQLGRTGDGGVDGVVNEDRLGLDRVYIQAKRYAAGSTVGRPDVQAFVGSLVGFGATKGVFVTTSSFSTQARDYAKHLTQRVILIDGTTLADLMIEHNVGVRINRKIEFKRIDEDFFVDED